jgi:BASS family bile acid:Na+ symporter
MNFVVALCAAARDISLGGRVTVAIDQVVSLLAAVTLIEMMATLGLGVNASDVLRVGKRRELLIRALLANYVIVPLAAVGLLLLFQTGPTVAAGFLVVAVCPGAPYAPPFTAMAKGNVTVAVGLMVLLAASSAILAPLLLGFLVPIVAGSAAVQINVPKMIGTLLGAQLLPLCLGLWIRRSHARVADRLKKPAGILSLSLNLLLLTLIIVSQFRTLAEIHFKGYFGMLCLVLATLAAGRVVTKRGQDNTAKSIVLTTSVRNVGVGLVIVTASFPGTPAITSATAYAIFQTVTIALLALAWGRHTRSVQFVEQKAA